VFNIRVSTFAAGVAFLLSFLAGVISGAVFPVVLLRALIFAVFFFVLAGGIHILIRKFLPELLAGEEGEEADPAGSHVDISLEDPENGVTAGFFDVEGTETPGLADRESPENGMGLDQNGEDDYTDKGEGGANSPDFGGGTPEGPALGEPPALPLDSGAVDVLPDLDSIEGTFTSSKAEAVEESTDYTPARSPAAKGKTNNAGGEFNPKDLASALQTILKRE
jgi:hypothetical protein